MTQFIATRGFLGHFVDTAGFIPLTSVVLILSTDLGEVYNAVETQQFTNVIANDTFTGTDGTELSSHTPNSGGSWTQHPVFTGSVVITNADRIRQNSTNNTIYLESTVPPLADYAVGCNIYAFSLPLTTGFSSGVCARFDAVNATGYTASYDPSKAARWSLDRWNAGTQTNLGSSTTTISLDTEYALLLTVQGSNIYLSVNGTVVASATPDSSPILETGQSGVWFGSLTSVPTDSTGVHVDTWQLYDSIFIFYNNEIQIITQFSDESGIGSDLQNTLLVITNTDSPLEIDIEFVSNIVYQCEIYSANEQIIITVLGSEVPILIESYARSIIGINDSSTGLESGLPTLLGSDQPTGNESILMFTLNVDLSSELDTQLLTLFAIIISDDLSSASETSISFTMNADSSVGGETGYQSWIVYSVDTSSGINLNSIYCYIYAGVTDLATGID